MQPEVGLHVNLIVGDDHRGPHHVLCVARGLWACGIDHVLHPAAEEQRILTALDCLQPELTGLIP